MLFQPRHSPPDASSDPAAYSISGILLMEPQHMLLLIMGSVFPAAASAITLFPTHPAFGVLLAASALATSAYIYVYLLEQKCTVEIAASNLRLKTFRGTQVVPLEKVKSCHLLTIHWKAKKEVCVLISYSDTLIRVIVPEPARLIEEIDAKRRSNSSPPI